MEEQIYLWRSKPFRGRVCYLMRKKFRNANSFTMRKVQLREKTKYAQLFCYDSDKASSNNLIALQRHTLLFGLRVLNANTFIMGETKSWVEIKYAKLLCYNFDKAFYSNLIALEERWIQIIFTKLLLKPGLIAHCPYLVT